MDEDDKRIQDYIEAALRANAESGAPGKVELTSLARELGLSDAEIAELDRRADELVLTGREYVGTGLWAEAEKALLQAKALKPWDGQALVELGYLYYLRSGQETDPSDARDHVRRAETLFREALAVSPREKRAIDGLSEARTLIAQLRHRGRKRIKDAVVRIVAVLILFASIGSIALCAVLEDAAPAPDAITYGAATAIHSDEAMDIPVVWKPAGSEKTLSYRPVGAKREVYEGLKPSWSIRVCGKIDILDKGVDRLSVRVSYLDAAGSVLMVRTDALIAEFDMPLHRGDTQPVSHLVYEDGPPTGVASIELEPSFVSYVKGTRPIETEVEYSLTGAAPEGIAFEFLARAETKSSYDDGSAFHDMQIVYSNSGSAEVALLKIRLEWYDQKGGKIEEQSLYLLMEDGTPLSPGERRAKRSIVRLPNGTGKRYIWKLFVEDLKIVGP